MPGIKIMDEDRQRIDTKFICSACKLLLYKPMQTACGHLMCHSCIEHLLGTSHPKCPEDGEELSAVNVFPDAFTNRELKALNLHCANPGCSWRSTHEKLRDHTEVCEHALIKCVHSQCQMKFKRSHLDEHLKSECEYGNVRCNYCCNDVVFASLNDHIGKSCVNAPVTCKYCKKDFMRKEIKRHETYICGNAPVKCEYHVVGCEKKLKRAELRQHNQDEIVNHQRLLLLDFSYIKSQLSNCTSRNEFQDVVERWKQSLAFLKLQVESLPVHMDQMADSQQVTNMGSRKGTHSQHAIVQSYTGTLVWKIEGYLQKRQDAIDGVKTALYSPPFYSDQFGYKMCAKIYLNGDGFGKGSHLSLFFVVMRGDYDALQPWPFQKKITMMLLDQGNGDHMIDAFRSDPQSSSFQRPESDMNIASGSPLFMPLDSLSNRQYIKDDVMFIKVIVD